MKKQLKQPQKYTHQFLKKKSQEEEQQQGHTTTKTKQIEKEKYVRKVINKPYQPSALRLEQINKTFEHLSEKSGQFQQELHINKQLLSSLVNLEGRFKCQCKRSVKYYCLKCNKKCKLLDIPMLKLPLQLHIIHHISEKINRSSVAPFRFLTQDVQYYPFSSKEENNLNQNEVKLFSKIPPPSPETFILFPHKNSLPLKEVSGGISNLIILDCTWFQTDQVIEQMQQRGYTNFIKLEGYQSIFWRYNHYGEEALSSAESVMFFFREFQQKNKGEINKYDPLMLLYALNMQKVERSMNE